MKHPDREEWVPFVFGEATAQTRKRLAHHLDQCPECAREVAGWRRTLHQLDRWPLPKVQTTGKIVPFGPAVRWALAAAVVLGVGLLIGRLTAPAPVDAAQLRAQVEASVRTVLQADIRDALQQVRAQTAEALSATEVRLAKASAEERQRLWRGLVEVIGTARAEDRRSVQAIFRQFQEQYNAEFVGLRKDLETLASTADEQMRQARLKLFQLAANNNSLE
jgi:hypothetical protein